MCRYAALEWRGGHQKVVGGLATHGTESNDTGLSTGFLASLYLPLTVKYTDNMIIEI